MDMSYCVSIKLNYAHLIEKKKNKLQKLATQGIYISFLSLESKEKENIDLDLVSNVIFDIFISRKEKSSKSY